MISLLFILVFGLLFGILFSSALSMEIKTLKKLSRHGRQKGFHIHHSMYGVVILLMLPFVNFRIVIELFLSSLSLGIILDHTLKEGFIFITRDASDYWIRSHVQLYYFLLSLQLPESETVQAAN